MPSPRNGGLSRKPRAASSAKLRKTAQTMATAALETLQQIMKSDDGQAAVRLAAAREILDRGYGRPKLGDPEAAPEELTVIVRKFTDPPGCKPADGAEG